MKWLKTIRNATIQKCKAIHHQKVKNSAERRGSKSKIQMRQNVHCNKKKNIFCEFSQKFCSDRSAFFWFSNDERGKVKAQNPEYGVGDIAKELGRRWADADPEVKGKYEQLADKDKARYEKVRKFLFF